MSATNSNGNSYESPVLTVNVGKMIADDQAIAHASKQLEDNKLPAEYLRINGGERIVYDKSLFLR